MLLTLKCSIFEPKKIGPDSVEPKPVLLSVQVGKASDPSGSLLSYGWIQIAIDGGFETFKYHGLPYDVRTACVNGLLLVKIAISR